MKIRPLVSILCITYNHEEYIAQCLESLVTQEVNFPYEILIYDDASTDNTQAIIKEYTEKYPKLIRPIYQEENQYSQGVRGITTRFNLSRAKGEYIALCEGDDFWTNKYKLQKQVDFLEKNKDYTVVFHPVRVFYEDKSQPDAVFPRRKDQFSVERLLEENFIQTNSVMYRRVEYEKLRYDLVPGDWYLHLYHARNSKIGFINDIMSAYRKHQGGVWWGGSADELYKKVLNPELKLLDELKVLYKDTPFAERSINKHAQKLFAEVIGRTRASTEILIEAAEQHPEHITQALQVEYAKNREKEEELKGAIKSMIGLQEENLKITKQLHEIVRSRSYRIGRFLTHPVRWLTQTHNDKN